MVIMFILGRDIYGKKQPVFIHDFAVNLSIDPSTLQSPSGSIKNAMLGLES
jgi:hypothetical protein